MDSRLYHATQVGFGLVTLVFYYLLLTEIKKGLAKSSIEAVRQRNIFNRIVFVLIGWTVFISAWSISGRMSDFSNFPFNVLPVLAIPMIAIIGFTFSKTAKEILLHIPEQKLIRLQSFRIIVELLLWALFISNLAPVQMTFEGRNFDILSGISAVAVAYLVSKHALSKTALIIWNLACLGLLINIVGVAILSMPTPFRTFLNDPANTIVTFFPIALLPGHLVPLAYALHFFSLRQLGLRK